jgi:hypothetical protein
MNEDGGLGDPLSGAGAAYIFERNYGGTNNWGEVRILRASDAQEEDQFGLRAAISGDRIVVGGYSEDGGAGDPFDLAGAVYIFERNHGGADTWGEVLILRAPEQQAIARYGSGLAITGDWLVVGAQLEDGGNEGQLTDSGGAYIYELADDIFLDGFESGDTTAWWNTVP